MTEEADIKEKIVQHFKQAFKKVKGWRPDWVDEGLKCIPDDLKEQLEEAFSEAEIKAAIFKSEGDKSPGPDVGCVRRQRWRAGSWDCLVPLGALDSPTSNTLMTQWSLPHQR
ncbi:hypothetical protein QJS10_CPB04g01289 [Acorus calamus]|uniref:Uncharacterized protein n=1 Tax=Acorus calamus TaxID=4465 RepID=A0AAV9EY48_ACOCL|nr:hypothetical protein QJS10_CPB04g01289 [Acorus calamus]